MHKSTADRLSNLYGEGLKAEDGGFATMDAWAHKVAAFLSTAIGPTEAASFLNLKAADTPRSHALRMGHIQGLVAKAEADEPAASQLSTTPVLRSAARLYQPTPDSRKVFLVHGHDNEAKEIMARFLEKIGLEAIILHEQPNAGRTIIEKFETHANDIAFAVVLLTPDDLGAVKTDPSTQKPRARQNVILELGYFVGRLGRARVCALHKGGVELPSDYQGVLYIDLDSAGAWKTKVAQEFVQAKLPIDLKGLVGG